MNEHRVTSVYTLLLVRASIFVAFLAVLVRGYHWPAILLFLLLVTLEGSRLWSLWGLRGVDLKWEIKPERLFPQEETELTLTITNKKRLPVLLYWEQKLPAGLLGSKELSGEGERTCQEERLLGGKCWLGGGACWKRSFKATALKRGVFDWPSATIVAKDGFGLFSREEKRACPRQIIIYPRLTQSWGRDLVPFDLIGDRSVERSYFPDPVRVVGLREYTPDLPARFINWKASAKRDTLQSKILEPSADLRLVVVVEARSFLAPQEADRLETVLSCVAATLAEAEERGIQIGLLANFALQGRNGPLLLPVRSGSSQLRDALELLARIKQKEEETLDNILRVEGQRLPWGTTLLVVGTPSLGFIPTPAKQVIYYPCT